LAACLPALAEDDKPKSVPTDIGGVKFPVPGTWVKQKATRQFRILQWGIPKAEGETATTTAVCYVSELRGGGGGAKGNLKRWEGEYATKDGEPKTETMKPDGVTISYIEVSGTFKESMGGPFAPGGKVEMRENYATLAAFVEIDGADSVYSIKLVGPKKSVLAQKKAFVEMLKKAKKD
jgi:hypothetical protein